MGVAPPLPLVEVLTSSIFDAGSFAPHHIHDEAMPNVRAPLQGHLLDSYLSEGIVACLPKRLQLRLNEGMCEEIAAGVESQESRKTWRKTV